jgi:hypothetical protein
MWDADKETKLIRNVFAHNLKEDSRTTAKLLKDKEEEPNLKDVHQNESTKEIESAFRKCRLFFEVLEAFHKVLLADPEAAIRLLQMKPNQNSSRKDSVKKNKKPRQAYIIWNNYNSNNVEKYRHIRNAILFRQETLERIP